MGPHFLYRTALYRTAQAPPLRRNCGTGGGLLECNLRVEGAAPRPRDVVAPLMRPINNSNWTQRKPDTRVFSSVTYRNSASEKQQFGHPIRTVVINNPAANMERYCFRPIEWSVGCFYRPPSIRSLLGDRYCVMGRKTQGI